MYNIMSQLNMRCRFKCMCLKSVGMQKSMAPNPFPVKHLHCALIHMMVCICIYSSCPACRISFKSDKYEFMLPLDSVWDYHTACIQRILVSLSLLPLSHPLPYPQPIYKALVQTVQGDIVRGREFSAYLPNPNSTLHPHAIVIVFIKS